MTRIQSAGAIKGRTYARPAQLQLRKGVTHHIESCVRGRGRPLHYSVYFITAVTNTHRGGGMEVAIFRPCVSALFEGDFGLASVVIGYTYKCIFLPLPHVLSKVLYRPDPLLSPTPAPTVITFLTWASGEVSEQRNEEKVRDRSLIWKNRRRR